MSNLPPLPDTDLGLCYFDEGGAHEMMECGYTANQMREYAAAAVAAEREACAKLCDEEAAYRTAREENPLPGDTAPAVQGHKAVTARTCATAIRARK